MNKLKFSLISVLIGLLAACSTEASYKVNQQLTSPYVTDAQMQKNNDDALAKRLNDVLDSQFESSDIKVVVKNYYVLLVGQAYSNGDKTHAEAICKRWPGTKSVYNYLTVTDQPSLNMNSSTSAKIMDMIKDHYDLNPDNVSVTTVDTVVYILGSNVGNLTALDSVITSAYSLPNVTKVVNLEQQGELDYSVK